MVPGLVEALISAQSVSSVMMLRQVVVQSDDQILQAEDAPGVSSRRFLADLVQALGLELPVVHGVLQLHQVLHVLPEDVGAADLPAITGELVQALARPRSPAVLLLMLSLLLLLLLLLLLRRVLLRHLGYPLLTRLESRARKGRQLGRQGRVVAVLVHRLRSGIVLLDSHGDRAGLCCK